jgi:hypothetical protein
MSNEVLAPFRFELVFTGLLLFDISERGATVFLVNARDSSKFENDPDLRDLRPSSFPNPHFPRFSYLMSQQVRNDERPPRSPSRVVADPFGDEIGICDLRGEDVTLDVTADAPFKPGLLTEAADLSSVSGTPFRRSKLLASRELPNEAIAARFHLSHGNLETLRISSTGTEALKVDFRPLKSLDKSSRGPDRTIADQLVLRVDNLRHPVEIKSSTKDSILLRPEQAPGGNHLRPVRASLSNYHKKFHETQIAAFDFLWFYELVEFTSQEKPSRLDLPIPVYLNGRDAFTGSSGVCPPITIGGGTQ